MKTCTSGKNGVDVFFSLFFLLNTNKYSGECTYKTNIRQLKGEEKKKKIARGLGT